MEILSVSVMRCLLAVLLICFSCLFHFATCSFELAVIHTNDIHAHVEEMNKYSSECKQKEKDAGLCYGGISRRVTKVNDLRKQYPSHSVLLNAGDNFQGTLWFNYYKGLVAAKFMKELGYDAMALGNHEFDNGVAGLVPFLDNVTSVFPVLSCNLDLSAEPRLKDKIGKHTILTVNGQRIGVIGFTTEETSFISNADKTVKFKNVVSSVRAEVQELTRQGINKIIGLGHYGYGHDMKLAAEVEGLDVIVGGHSHTFLYTGTPPLNDVPEGPYPTVITKDNGEKTLVVQAYWSGKYLGFINVTFDDRGRVTKWQGAPILLDNSIAKDPATEAEVAALLVPLAHEKSVVMGKTAVYLEGSSTVCRLGECNMGNLVTDGMVDYFVGRQTDNASWTEAAIAIINSGGIRAPIEQGNITRGELLTLMPFGNTVDVIDIKGKYLRQALEHSVENYSPIDKPGAFLQMSGLLVKYDLSKPKGHRVVSVEARCQECLIPAYSPLDDTDVYRVVAQAFIIKGGDGYSVLQDHHERWYQYNFLDIDVLSEYLKKFNPVTSGLEGRVQFTNSSYSDTPCPVGVAGHMTFNPFILFVIVLSVVLSS
ncbi:5'-nucleotidase-like [Mizuhopecten yessoensis]|uniref:5'-nucleotidase n=1 Tax=Mizuhopecten yessoensis TaxID=6573 RepID=A0A210QNA0_MIZYE|nr:5'-nucleotidase-like [Mizuhopecten yessoensis]OWF50209.1 5'-nucleotidase [Mizuhopecten yessoensis]